MASSPSESPFDQPLTTGRYRRVFIGRVHVVRWLGPVEPGDFTDLLHELGRYVVHTGSKVVHVPIQSASHPPLSSETRSEAIRVMRTAFKYCESIHNVIESQGFSASVIRSVVLAISMAAGLRGKIFIHTSLDEAFEEVAPRVLMTKVELWAKARSVGVTP